MLILLFVVLGIIPVACFFTEYVIPEMKRDLNGFKQQMVYWVSGIGAVVGLVIVLSGVASVHRCADTNCNNIVDEKSNYCDKCERKHKKAYEFSDSSSSKVSTRNPKYDNQSGSLSTKSKSSTSSKKHSTSYMHEPDDYNFAEDFADDAVGYDFDDWDEAYDYWENY